MQTETSVTPHVWLLLSNLITAILAVFTTLKTIQFKQKREPAEVRKIDAETTSIYHGITLETHREIQAVIEKAEVRREAWLLKEDQMRTQVVFWRNKAEELDGELIDSREANELLKIRLTHHEKQEEKLLHLLKYHHISYAELDQPKE